MCFARASSIIYPVGKERSRRRRTRKLSFSGYCVLWNVLPEDGVEAEAAQQYKWTMIHKDLLSYYTKICHWEFAYFITSCINASSFPYSLAKKFIVC